MKFVRKIALLSLIASVAAGSLIVTMHARSDEQSSSDSKKNSVVNDLRKKHKLEDTPPISLPSTLTLKRIREAILTARFGSDYKAYTDAVAAEQKTKADRRTQLKAQGYSDSDIDAINDKIKMKDEINLEIQKADLSGASDTNGKPLLNTNTSKTYNVNHLHGLLHECKSQVEYPTTGAHYQDIVKFLNESRDDGDVSVVTLADAELFIKDILSDIQIIRETYKSADKKKKQ